MSLKNLYENMPSEEILRRMRVEDFSTHCRMEKELNDPVMTTIFTALIGTGGFTIGGTTITYAAVASAIATTALMPGFRRLLK